MLKGVAASPGIEIGKVYILQKPVIEINQNSITTKKIPLELKRLINAVEVSKSQLAKIRDRAEKELGAEKARIFEAHLMILEDAVLLDAITDMIKTEHITAENALTRVINEYVETFEAMHDEYLRERAADIKDIGERLVKNVLGIPIQSLTDLSEEVIIIAKDLTPSDTAQMDKEKVIAFAADMGGPTSHTAIMARSLEIPAVVGLGDFSLQAKDGDTVIIDGNKGAVILNPDEEDLQKYRKLRYDYQQYIKELKELKELPAVTTDQLRRVELSANIGTPKDCEGANANGAEGVGLYRTEFLYMDRSSLPSEEEQYEAYKAAVEAMVPNPVIIRTLDIGGDKKLPYLDMPDELNPFLGWRAIRMCLDRTEILKTQLKAILRAGCHGRVRIMYPMISGVHEVRRANAILNEVREELEREGKAYDLNVQVGIMIEIPSAAITADILAKEVDFFSIGTNDLIQYTLAVDRMNEKISDLYEPLHPAVLRLIKNVIDASHKAGIWTGMCGEMAGDPQATAILLGMGLDEFSMSASSIPRVKKIIRSLTYSQAQELARQALALENPDEIRKLALSLE